MSKYNLNYSFGDDLWDIPENPNDVLKYILEQKEKLKSVIDPKERVTILGKIGSYTRMLGNLEEAESLLGEAVKLIDEHNLDIGLWAANGIRLAHVYQWMECYDIADEMFSSIVDMCKKRVEIEKYLNFALQHYGKLFFDLEEYKEALKYFKETMQLRQKIGDLELIKSTQHAIDVTRKKIKEDNVIKFPNNDFQGTSFKEPSELLEMVKEQLISKENGPLTLDDLNEELSKITVNQNSLSKAPFLGLSSNQMNDILYLPFDFNNDFFTINLDSTNTADIPILKQAFYFLEKLKQVKDLKCTQKGNLPRAFVVEMYTEFFSKERYALKPSREDDLPQLTRLKHLLDMSGLIKKRKNNFSLTKKGEDLLNNSDFNKLFKLLVNTLFNKWNWGYSDGHSDLDLIQSSVIFNIYLLHKKAQDWVLDEELGQYFLNAFPALVREVRDSYWGPEQEIIRCFTLRFLDRICLPLGMLDVKEEGEGFDRDTYYRVSELFSNNVNFFDEGEL
jgi:tetratricopeptide (TPR) repeat protein